MSDIKRWYDNCPKFNEMLIVLSNLADKDLDEISVYLYQVVNIFWKQKKTKEQTLSIGKDKLFGYYKAYQGRRWYDKNPSLKSAINILSTLKVNEIEEIVDGFLVALREAGIHKIYSAKKQELSENQE